MIGIMSISILDILSFKNKYSKYGNDYHWVRDDIKLMKMKVKYNKLCILYLLLIFLHCLYSIEKQNVKS